MKRVKIKKPTRLEELTLETKQNFSHLHSASIRAERDLLQYEASQVNERIASLQTALINTRERGKEIQAKIVGLSLVLEKR